MVSSNATVAERFTPRDDDDDDDAGGLAAGEFDGTELRLVIDARTEGGAVIPTLFGVEAIQSVGFSFVVGWVFVMVVGDELDSIRRSWFSIDSDRFSGLLDSILFRRDVSDAVGGVTRGRRWNGMNGDERVLFGKDWLHRHKWWLTESLIIEQNSFCLLSSLEKKKKKSVSEKRSILLLLFTSSQDQYNYIVEH